MQSAREMRYLGWEADANPRIWVQLATEVT